MIDILWNLFQQSDIRHGKWKDSIQDLKHKGHRYDLDELSFEFSRLEQRHEQLKLVTLALWSLLRDHSGLLESDLRRYVEKVDLLDGEADGKVSPSHQLLSCTGCNRNIINTAAVCPYCGTRNAKRPFDTA